VSQFGEGLLTFRPESFVFLSPIQKSKDQNIHNYCLALCFVSVWKFVPTLREGQN